MNRQLGWWHSIPFPSVSDSIDSHPMILGCKRIWTWIDSWWLLPWQKSSKFRLIYWLYSNLMSIHGKNMVKTGKNTNYESSIIDYISLVCYRKHQFVNGIRPKRWPFLLGYTIHVLINPYHSLGYKYTCMYIYIYTPYNTIFSWLYYIIYIHIPFFLIISPLIIMFGQ
jgi:hypothetical protein